jgi:hypothetical protein
VCFVPTHSYRFTTLYLGAPISSSSSVNRSTSTYRLKITFINPLLGSQPTHDIATDYLAKKHGIQIDAEEEKLLPDVLEKGTTVFHTLEDGTSALMNYHILGFLKESGKIFNRKINGIRNLRYKVQSYVLVTPRVIPLHILKANPSTITSAPCAQTVPEDRVSP